MTQKRRSRVSQVQGRQQKNFQEGATEKDRKVALLSLAATEKRPKMAKKDRTISNSPR